MNRAELLIDALKSGPLSRRDLIDRCGFHLWNNAATEARRDHGVNVVCERDGASYVYRIALLSESPRREPRENGSGPSPEQVCSGDSLSDGQIGAEPTRGADGSILAGPTRHGAANAPSVPYPESEPVQSLPQVLDGQLSLMEAYA